MINITVQKEKKLWKDCEDDTIIEIIQSVFDHCKYETQGIEIGVILTDNTHVQSLNKNYRGKNKPTNVLSFPAFSLEEIIELRERLKGPEEVFPLGDIVLAYETIVAEAEMEHKTFQNHFTHLLTHGVLHLLGYDHENEEEALIMESIEIAILKEWGISNPYGA